jgi:hypothetical protein
MFKFNNFSWQRALLAIAIGSFTSAFLNDLKNAKKIEDLEHQIILLELENNQLRYQ